MTGSKSLLLALLSLVSLSAQAEEMSLKAFLGKVHEQNLDLKIEAAKSDAAHAKSIGVNIPPPTASLIQMKETNGNTAKGYEIDQTIPFPTKLWGDSSARKYEAKSQEETRLGRENETLAQARLLYFSLWSAQEKLALLSEKKSILKEHINLSRSSARSDSFASIHLLKAESEFDLLENEISSAEQDFREKQTQVATFINTDPATFKITTTEPPLSEIPKVDSIDTSHQIQAIKYSLEGMNSRVLEARSSWLPDFNLRYKAMGPSSMAGRYNEVMLGITVPFVFFWEPYAASSQASAQKSQAEYELEKLKRISESERITLQSKAEALKKQIETLTEKLIPRAEKRMKLAHNLAPRDMETLQDHREAMEAAPELKLKELELRSQYEQAVSSLEKYVNKGQSYE